MSFEPVHALLVNAHRAGAFPAASIEVGRHDGPVWQTAIGQVTFETDAAAASTTTIFDLASLTKVIATTSLIMQAVTTGLVELDTPLYVALPSWNRSERPPITVRHLLDHSSGLPAHARLWTTASGREAYTAALTALPLERVAGEASVYSDPGFILLGFAVEHLFGRDLLSLTTALLRDVAPNLCFLPPAEWRARIAPTELDAWRQRLLVGEVHDENAAALGGVAGHAGLFGTVSDVGAFARLVLRTFRQPTALGSPALMQRFAARTGVPGSSRALGWDTMLPTSSCGTRLSPSSIGHTGFTGTSLWIDHARDFYVVLLSNRVHPSRTNDAFVKLRPVVHDAVVDALGSRGVI